METRKIEKKKREKKKNACRDSCSARVRFPNKILTRSKLAEDRADQLNEYKNVEIRWKKIGKSNERVSTKGEQIGKIPFTKATRVVSLRTKSPSKKNLI